MSRWTDLSAAEIAALSAKNRASRVHKADANGNIVQGGPGSHGPGKEGSVSTKAPKSQATRSDSKNFGTREAVRTGRISRTRVSESTETRTVVFWWDSVAAKQHGLEPRHLVGVPNAGAGAQRGQAGKMKAEGARSGFPDLFLVVPIGNYHGLFTEMKALDGHAQPHQRDYHALLRAQGYAVAVCKGAKHAQEVILRYLAGVMV